MQVMYIAFPLLLYLQCLFTYSIKYREPEGQGLICDDIHIHTKVGYYVEVCIR